MKCSYHAATLSRKPSVSPRARLGTVVAALLLGGALPQAAAQTADFNAGNDNGWTHYTLLGYGAAEFSFPPDDTGGKAYRIYAPPTGDDPWGMGNARAGSVRTDKVYVGRFSLGVDLLEWNDAWPQEAGVLFFVSDVGLGSTDGYSATYSSGYRNLYITLISDERDGGAIGTFEGVVLNKSHDYRMVVSSHDGYLFVLQLFDKLDLANPWCSVVCQDSASTHFAGVNALFAWQRDYPSATEGAVATFDNYVATAPAEGAMPATVTDLAPPPRGKATAFYPTIGVTIVDRDSNVDTSSIQLRIDGTLVPNADLTIDPTVHKDANPGAKDFTGATVSYTLSTLLPWGSQHTTSVEFADYFGLRQTNTWVWTSAYPFLPASTSLPLGSLSVRGFDFRMAQSDNGCATLANSLDRARQQLASPPQIPIDRSAAGILQTLGWDKTAEPETGNNVPGLCAASANPACGDHKNIAVESTAYLELPAGLHRFRIDTDDRAGVYSGLDSGDADAVVWWENPGNTANSTFDVFVEASGLYPVSCLWEETGGGAHLYLYSVDLDGGTETLVNDPADPAGVVKAWYPLVCLSAGSVAGPYAADAAAVNVVTKTNLVGGDCPGVVVGQKITGGTFKVPVAGSMRFYRVQGPRNTTVSKITRTGATVAIDYTLE